MQKEWITHRVEETALVAAEVAAEFKLGDVVGLVGPLGSGKTAFVQGMAKALGVDTTREPVVSPTFTLFQIYSTGRIPLYHFDLYRLQSLAELEAIGYEEYWWGEGVTVVEWFDQIEVPALKKATLVTFEVLSDQSRRIFLR